MSKLNTDRSPSPISAVSIPSWAPPRAPLPPHRLAKLANALGVSTPLPASNSYPTYPPLLAASPNSAASFSFPDHLRRSPTPSAASAQTFTPSTSKFLLHVLPPAHLPHDPQNLDHSDSLFPPPPASGYHPQFRRGVLVPVYPTLPTQLAAIAREYALPSTLGMVLYLITTSPAPSSSKEYGADTDEPGPRVSEEIWKHIWMRVSKSEKDEAIPPVPRPLGLGISVPSQSAPTLLQDLTASPIRTIPDRAGTPNDTSQGPSSSSVMTPSPSSTSHSAFSSQSELDPPESMSSVPDPHADDLPLPGLNSPALVPILAKVEFDIDRRKAGWYDAWVRSRRVNHAKRAESRASGRRRGTDASDVSGAEGEGDEDRSAPINLRLVKRMERHARPSFLHPEDAFEDDEDDYMRLPDSPAEEEVTERINGDRDPLADVFGTDAEMWADLHASANPGTRRKRAQNPNVVELALDGAALGELDDFDDADRMSGDDIREVEELWARKNRPSLALTINGQANGVSSPVTIRKHAPPPLHLTSSLNVANDVIVTGASPDSAGHSSPGDSLSMKRSPLEEKREGAIFDELDLGLDISGELDDNDPHDHRRSQYLMSATLDEIERNLVQFSPRKLRSEELLAEDLTPVSARLLSPPNKSWSSPNKLNVVATPPLRSAPLEPSTSWPAVPYSQISSRDSLSEQDEDRPPSPPRIAFNGISTDIPVSPMFKGIKDRNSVMSDESLARKRELEEENSLYPPLVPPFRNRALDSPVIPLSPDPFGRFPSAAESQSAERPPSVQYDDSPLTPRSGRPQFQNSQRKESLATTTTTDTSRPTSQAPSSRFSFDSVASDDVTKLAPGPSKTSSSLMSVKSIKKLWRRTNKSSSSQSFQPDSGRTSPVPPRPSLSEDQQSLPPSRPASRSMPRPSPVEPTFPADVQAAVPVRPGRKSSVSILAYAQDGRYPSHPPPSRPPPLDPSRQPSPQIPYQNSQTTPTTPSLSPPPIPPAPEARPERNSIVRKSILRSWRSASGSLSAQGPPKPGSSTTTTTPRSSTEQNENPTRKRRPSVADATAGRRGSIVSASPTLVDIPPSPALPDQYAGQGAAPRTASRQSQQGEKRGSVRQRPSMSSNESMSPRMTARSPPRGGISLAAPRTSGESYESRPSFDASQFEIVSPKMDSFVIESQLSYPYHGLDQSMSTE